VAAEVVTHPSVAVAPRGRWKAHWGTDPRERLRRLVAEFIGTAGITFVLGTGAATFVLFAGVPGWAAGPLLAFAVALWVAAAVYFLGDISAHFNPAVTLAFAVGREIEWTIAAIFGSFLAWMFFGTAGNLARTDPQPGQDIQAMFFEIILTFGLVLLVLGMANGPKLNTRFIPLGAAAYIAAAATIGGPYEGASMNPARSIGPAVMTGHLENLWPYIAGPLLGGVLAVVVATVLRGSYQVAAVPSEAPTTVRDG
jgi:glycerol uptake facilitator-like aquaporin